ncbi:MAG: hypothetical protein R3211_10400, partial [Balneolaceae bacterium]|nr:hypothetical protein [Balneolaceae bacterium]
PEVRWANMEAPAVKKAWQLFVNAIQSEVRMPAGDAGEVVRGALEEAMEMLIRPRHKIPEVLFEEREELSYDELLERLDRIVIYRHFATLLPRYMERKELDRLSKEQCREVIARTDEKTTEHYSPLNWSQVLEPLFNLLDDTIDTDILGLFFEDHNMTRFARHFRSMEGEISKIRFIEELSSPKLLDTEGFDQAEKEQLELEKQKNIALEELEKSKQIEKETDIAAGTEEEEDEKIEKEDEPVQEGEAAVDEEEPEEEELESDAPAGEEERPEADEEADTREKVEAVFGTEPADEQQEPDQLEPEDLEDQEPTEPEEEPDSEEVEEEPEEEPEFAENPILTHFHETRKKKGRIFEVDEEDESINKLFKSDEEKKREQITESYSLNDIFGQGIENQAGPGESSGPSEEQPVPDEGRPAREQVTEEGDESETPMWKRFLPDEDEGQQQPFGLSADTETPAAEPAQERQKSGNRVQLEEILDLFEGEKERFVDTIFRGSERAFDEAMEELAEKDNWRSASRFIEQEVFKRNLVDMYSEDAVDFTDLLQTYFLKKTET